MTDLWSSHLETIVADDGAVAYVWDPGADMLRWGGDLFALLGLRREEWPQDNARVQAMINPQDAPARLAWLHDALRSAPGKESSFSYRIRRADGQCVTVAETGDVREGPEGHRVFCGILRQKTASARAATGETKEEPLSSSAEIALPESVFVNHGRAGFYRKLEEVFDTREPGATDHGYVLAVGLDRMALFNEVLGPRYADEIIVKTEQRLRQIAGESGFVARIDGDVFGVLFRRGPHNEMPAVARYILNSFYNVPLQTAKGPVAAGISIGGLPLDARTKDPAAAVTMAEMAMHVAKDKGRSCFVSHAEAALRTRHGHRMLQAADTFLRAMKDGRLCLAFQPVISTRDQGVSFHECLIRIIDKDGQTLPAGSFMPAVEEMGLSRLVDQYALRMAVRELEMFPGLSLSVNVSNLSLADQDWLRDLVSILRARPSVAQRLIVEITESSVIQDPVKVQHIVRTLKEMGCRVALDDFGAGYTAFSQLKDLKVDLVKIDQSFVRNIDEAHNHLFVRTLKSLADGVNVETVGEGAETQAEATLLAEDGIDHIQGFVFGLPRIERLWLPENHSHRKITPAPVPGGIRMEEDIVAWAGVAGSS